MSKPKVLLFDIETAPILGYVWDLWDQNVGVNQIKKDWHVLSWSAKWLKEENGTKVYGPHNKIMYQDQRKCKDIENDKALLKAMWELLDEADVVITQNGKRFDKKKLFARFAIHGFKPPSSFQHIDTAQEAKQHFGFTSNGLEYLSEKLCKKYKKSKHKKFPGFALWEECLLGNKEAWNEMEQYNKKDVLTLEELYHKLAPWMTNNVNFNVYHDELTNICSRCGHNKFKKNGFYTKGLARYQRYACSKCGSESRSGKNLLSKAKRDSLKRNIVR